MQIDAARVEAFPGQRRWRRRSTALACAAILGLLVAARGDTQPPQAASLEQLALQSLQALNMLSFGSEPAAALASACLKKPRTVERVLAALDANGDGALDPFEVFQADVLAIARQLEGPLGCKAPDVQLGPDDGPLFDPIFGYLFFAMLSFNPFLPDEVLPAVQRAAMRGDPQAPLRRATFRTLADLVANLATRPEEGDMTGPDMTANETAKADLLRRLDRVFPLVQAGDAKALKPELLALRGLADGDPVVPDVVAPRAASRIVFHLDALLALPASR